MRRLARPCRLRRAPTRLGSSFTMGLLERILGRPTSRTATAMTLHASKLVEVVGESHRQDALRRVAARTSDCGPFLKELSGRTLKIAETEPRRRWFRAHL